MVPKVSAPVLRRRLDTELQMGAGGARQLVSRRGLEFTVGMKYETNVIMLFASLFIQLFPFAQGLYIYSQPVQARLTAGKFNLRL